jgi:hypothetical protein
LERASGARTAHNAGGSGTAALAGAERSSRATRRYAPPSVGGVLRSPGQPLDAATRAFMEPRFGHDFSQVRVHSDREAADSAQEMGAHAFSVGRDIVFRRDAYKPTTTAGRHLLTHELVHVAQSGGMAAQPGAPVEVGDNAGAHEQAAREAATGLMPKAHLASSPNVLRSQSDQAADNVTTMDNKFHGAIALEKFGDAAVVLNGYSDQDMRARLSLLQPNQLRAVREAAPGVMPGWSDRVTRAVDQALKEAASRPVIPSPKDNLGRREPNPIEMLSAVAKLRRAKDIAKEKNYLKEDVAAEIESLFSTQSLTMLVAFAALYIAAQVTPAGWVADILAGAVIVVSVVFLGLQLFEIFKHLFGFLAAINARSEADLDQAARHLTQAIAKAGVAVVIALLTHTMKGAKGTKPYDPPPTGYADVVTDTGLVIRVVAEAAPKATPASVPVAMASQALAVQPPTGESGAAGSTGGEPKNEAAPKTEQAKGKAEPAAEKKGDVGRILEERQVGETTVIKSEVGVSPGKRLGYERLVPRGVQVGRRGWERAHSQGQITGAESSRGILLAPEEVNQQLQKSGIEQFISDLNLQKADNVKLYLTTETQAHPSNPWTLKSIVYRVEAALGNERPRIVFEADLAVENKAVNPRIDIGARHVTDVGPYLKPLPGRQ